MELDKIENLLEKYFEGMTTTAEENELRNYFSSSNVAPHLEQYKPMFEYFSAAKEQQFDHDVMLDQNKKGSKNKTWLFSVAASVIVLLGISTYSYFNASKPQDLGTYDNPEVAFRETQKALAMLSSHVNTGIESIQYVQEYEDSKHLIFKQ